MEPKATHLVIMLTRLSLYWVLSLPKARQYAALQRLRKRWQPAAFTAGPSGGASRH